MSSIKFDFHQRLNACLKLLRSGKTLPLASGHTLVLGDDPHEPGFLMISDGYEVIMQIGSDAAWMSLVQHARDMTPDETINMVLATPFIREPKPSSK